MVKLPRSTGPCESEAGPSIFETPLYFFGKFIFLLRLASNFFLFFTLRSSKTYFLAPPEAIHVPANMKDSSSGQSGKRNYQIRWPRPFPSGKWKITGPKSIGFSLLGICSGFLLHKIHFFFWSLLSHAKFSCHPFQRMIHLENFAYKPLRRVHLNAWQ